MGKVVLHTGKRKDTGEMITGYLTKMWAEYHIILPEDENTSYLVEEDSIEPKFIPGRWYVSQKQLPQLQDVVLICKGWFDEKYADSYEALRAYQAKLCNIEEKNIGYGDILQFSLLPACEAFLSKRKFCALFYDKMFCEDVFMCSFRQVRTGQIQKGKELSGKYIIDLLSNALFQLRNEEFLFIKKPNPNYCVI